MAAKIPPIRRKLCSDTLIGIAQRDALRRGEPIAPLPPRVAAPPPRSSVATLVGGLEAYAPEEWAEPTPPSAASWPAPSSSSAPEAGWLPPWTPAGVDDTPEDEWCTALRSQPGFALPSRAAPPPLPPSEPHPAPTSSPIVAAPSSWPSSIADAPSSDPGAPLPGGLPGGRVHSADAVFVATVHPPARKSFAPLAVLVAAVLAVTAMAVAAMAGSSDEGPAWRLTTGLAPPAFDIGGESTAAEPPAADESTRAAPTAAAQATTAALVVDVGSRPCEVWVDGVGRQVVGRTVIRVRPGPHAIACRRGGKLAGRRVDVASGQSALVTFR
jgi:hypothetical protein